MNKPGSATQDRNDGPANLGANAASRRCRVVVTALSRKNPDLLQAFRLLNSYFQAAKGAGCFRP
jgi:hypothetical protein